MTGKYKLVHTESINGAKNMDIGYYIAINLISHQALGYVPIYMWILMCKIFLYHYFNDI